MVRSPEQYDSLSFESNHMGLDLSNNQEKKKKKKKHLIDTQVTVESETPNDALIILYKSRFWVMQDLLPATNFMPSW